MIEEIAREHAIECHQKINHLYNDKPYSFHLEKVREVGEKYKHNIPEDDRDDVFAAEYEHDTIEDTDCSFSDIVKLLNLRVAMIVKAVTTGKGTRKEKFNDDYYRNIKNTKYATFVKLCDRISNVEQGLFQTKLFEMYKKEHPHFKEMLYVKGEYEDMWKHLDSLFL